MNDQRRKAINSLIAEFEKVKELATGNLSDIKDRLEALRDEEQEYFDNMHDNLKSGDKGSRAEQAVSEIDDQCSNLDTLICAFDEVDMPSIDLG